MAAATTQLTREKIRSAWMFLVPMMVVLIAVATGQGAFDAVAFPGSQVGVAMAARDDLAASAQGLQGATLQLSAGAVALFAGFAYEGFGRGPLFIALAVLLVAGVAASFWIARPLIANRDELVFGQTEVAAPAT